MSDPTNRELILTRLIDAPRENIFKAWTEPELLKQWFAPLPFTTPTAELNVRAGGSFVITMRGPDGVEMPVSGLYLEVIENERLVYTNAMPRACGDFEIPAIVVILTFECEAGKTRYTARVLHWTVADCQLHEAMGFQEGWGQCADQLATVAANLRNV